MTGWPLQTGPLAKEKDDFGDDQNNNDQEEKIANGKLDRELSKQVSQKSKKADDKDKEVKQSKSRLILRLMKLNQPEWPYILVGCIFSVAFGSLTPLFGTLFGDVMNVFIPTLPSEDAREDMKWYALYFGGIGAGFMLSQIIMGFTFSLSGARLVERVRGQMFSSMLSQEIGWYDLEENNTGALCARLSSSAEVCTNWSSS